MKILESNEGYLTQEEAAKLLRVTVRTVIDWRHAGYLPHFRIGRSIRFRRKDLDAALDARFKRGAQ
jgi:excisionase family DNA binding protein